MMSSEAEQQEDSAKNLWRSRIIVLVVILLIGLGYIFRQKPLVLDYPPGSQIKILRPIAGPAEFKRLSATLLRDLTKFRSPARNNPLLSCGRFKPDGATFPDGLEVVFPLAKAEAPGSILWIVNGDFEDVPENVSWLGTGESAKVNADGLSATGTVYHFSYIGLVKEPLKNIEAGSRRRPSELYVPEVQLSEFQKRMEQSVKTANEVLQPHYDARDRGLREYRRKHGLDSDQGAPETTEETSDWGDDLDEPVREQPAYQAEPTDESASEFDDDLGEL